MILNDVQIRALILSKEMIKDYIDLEIQLQPHGFDLTVKNVYKYDGLPEIDFSNEKRILPTYKKIKLRMNSSTKESFYYWFLTEGSYLVLFNELVKLPSNMKAIGIHRSSIIRCDCLTAMGNWDAGYEGRGITRLEVGKNGLILHKNARVSQLIFMTTDDAEKPYDGIYNRESIAS